MPSKCYFEHKYAGSQIMPLTYQGQVPSTPSKRRRNHPKSWRKFMHFSNFRYLALIHFWLPLPRSGLGVFKTPLTQMTLNHTQFLYRIWVSPCRQMWGDFENCTENSHDPTIIVRLTNSLFEAHSYFAVDYYCTVHYDAVMVGLLGKPQKI